MRSQFRSQFPIFSTQKNKALIYLDSAATSQKPEVVVQAIESFLTQDYGTVHRAIYGLSMAATQKYTTVRERVRKFIGASQIEEIIFTRGTTDGINLVASSFGEEFLQEKDEILVVETEHHSNIIPWQMLCERKKAILRPIPVNDRGEIEIHVVEKLLSSLRVKLVAIAHVANATGVIHPIKDVITLAHTYGAKVLVDAAQSISHFPLSVRDLHADFLVFSSHKMYGPTGVGVLYGKKELLEAMPPYQGGGDMVNQVSFEKTTYQPLPLKFEAGTPSIVEVIGLGAAIEFLESIGIDRIQAWEEELTTYALARFSEIPQLRLLCHPIKRSSIISFNLEGCHPLDVGTLLDAKGIAVRTGHLCAQTALKRFGLSSTIRVSFAIYNAKEEIDILVDALKQIIDFCEFLEQPS